MMKPNTLSVTGTVQDIFAHRFTLRTAEGVVLADLTPRGEEKIKLSVGDKVTIEGERKPSEFKVSHIRCGEVKLTIEHHDIHADKHAHRAPKAPDADPEPALAAARAAGFDVVGAPRRKPKHFEILGCRDGDLAELHVTLDGKIRHTKPVSSDDGKWRAETASAPL